MDPVVEYLHDWMDDLAVKALTLRQEAERWHRKALAVPSTSINRPKFADAEQHARSTAERMDAKMLKVADAVLLLERAAVK